MTAFWNRRKRLDSLIPGTSHQALKPTLGWPHLVGLGVGGIVGTGIYTLTGVGAGLAGPGVILSFVIAGLVCACAALAYAEMSTMMPVAGSAYTYSYVVLGEGLAWIVGWSLILEYTVVCSVVAVGWSGYAGGVIRSLGWNVPESLLAGPHAGGLINVPAIVISLAVAGLLALGTRESATVNLILVFVKLLALGLFVALAIPAFDADNFQPFAPYGFGATEIDGVKHGVMAAAAIIFFAFYGFDAVSTAAEETKNPSRDLKIGIIGSMLSCTLIYMIVAAAALGGADYRPAHGVRRRGVCHRDRCERCCGGQCAGRQAHAHLARNCGHFSPLDGPLSCGKHVRLGTSCQHVFAGCTATLSRLATVYRVHADVTDRRQKLHTQPSPVAVRRVRSESNIPPREVCQPGARVRWPSS